MPTDPLELGCLRAHGGEGRIRLRRIHACGCLLFNAMSSCLCGSMLEVGDVGEWSTAVAYRSRAGSSCDCQTVQTLLKLWVWWAMAVVEEQIAASEALAGVDPRGVAAASARPVVSLSLNCG